jgi:co-chaperonin GroES (HSP10)
MKLRMLNDTVLVRLDAESEVQSDNPEIERIIKEGIIKLPDNVQGFYMKSPRRGEVVTIGPDVKQQVRPGDRIIFTRFGGVPFKWEEEELRMMREYEVLAKEEA